LKILAFEKQLGTRFRIKKLACHNWRAVNMRRNPLMRFFDIAQFRNIQFFLISHFDLKLQDLCRLSAVCYGNHQEQNTSKPIPSKLWFIYQ